MRFINRVHLQPINAHPTEGDGLHRKVYGRVPDPFFPPRPRTDIKRRDRVGNARLNSNTAYTQRRRRTFPLTSVSKSLFLDEDPPATDASS